MKKGGQCFYNCSIIMHTNNENSRMSRIADHNIYLNTDTLYEPLRNALRKSTISSNFLSPQRYLADNHLTASRLAKNARSLSPAETEMIKKSILIPVNKELVPTRNLQKVIGKQFITVDMEERIGEAISPAEFSRVKTGTVEQIVYQIKQDEPPFQSSFTNTARANPQPFPKMHVSQQFRTSAPQIVTQPQPFISQVQSPVKVQQPLTLQRDFVNSKVNQHSQSFGMPQNALRTQNLNSPLKQFTGINQPPLKIFQGTTLPTFTSQQFIREPAAPHSNQTNLQNKPSLESGKSSKNIAVKAYDFRQSTASKQDSILKMRKEREEYKYNLFSLIDQGGNNGCQNGCFGSNEVCAPKISTNPWK